jgi:BolA protein
MGPVEASIRSKLEVEFSPAHLEVINESFMHSVPEGSESHFKLVIVADQFDTKRAVQRHQMVYQVLKEPLQQTVHALAVHTYTPTEWASREDAPKSPSCLGGSK